MFRCYLEGVALNRRARKMTATKAMPAITRPGAPYSSAKPVPGNAVAVGNVVSAAAAACVSAAATVAVAGSTVLVAATASVG